MQICEQINEKKNVRGIEFVVFFSHTVLRLQATKKDPFFSDTICEKKQNRTSGSIW